MNWHDTERSKPHSHTPVLCYWDYTPAPMFDVAVYSFAGDYWHEEHDEDDDFLPPSHWAYLEGPENASI